MDKNEQLHVGLNAIVPDIKEHFQIHSTSKKSKLKAKKIAYIITDSFLRNITHGTIDYILIAASDIEKNIFGMAYENKLDIKIPKDYQNKQFKLNPASKQKPKLYSNFSKKIMDILVD